MPAFAAVFPIVPGKTEEWRQFSRELAGPRREAWEASRRRLGVTAERAFLQQTPQGDLAIIYGEAPDPAGANQGLAVSSDPFDQWFRQRVLELHGVDLTQPPPGPPPELVAEL